MVHNIGCYLGRQGYANFDGSPVALKEMRALSEKSLLPIKKQH